METSNISQYLPRVAHLVCEAVQRQDEAYQSSIKSYALWREIMKDVRAKTGFSAKRFGAMCGVTQSYIFALESGRAKWSQKLISRINEGVEEYLETATLEVGLTPS